MGSHFLGHTRSADLLQHFNDATSKLNKGKILQVGMDGPNANIKFHKDLVEEISSVDPELPNLLDIGTCGLHEMHGAFRTGFTASGWILDTILKSLYYLFNESPARRSDYTTYKIRVDRFSTFYEIVSILVAKVVYPCELKFPKIFLI